MQPKIRAVVVEDTQDNRETLIRLLEMECPEIEIVGEAPTLEVAYNLFKEQEVDLAFLDIQMKMGTSFDLLERLYNEDGVDFDIIFVTAYGTFEYATKAIEYSALDYITKPIDPNHLRSAVDKVVKKRRQTTRPNLEQVALLLENLNHPGEPSKKMAFHLPKGVIEFVEVKSICRLEADGPITYVYLKDRGKLTAMKNLGQYGQRLLDDYHFFQISNSEIVNLDYVKRYHHSDLCLVLEDNTRVTASRRKGQEFKKYWSDRNESAGGKTWKRILSGFKF